MDEDCLGGGNEKCCFNEIFVIVYVVVNIRNIGMRGFSGRIEVGGCGREGGCCNRIG